MRARIHLRLDHALQHAADAAVWLIFEYDNRTHGKYFRKAKP